ncbi:unnamed protein product [Blepharisma stoltei]|uniref:Uncharacterized protein n=1 Tax=Blepharisma stoltei TaxID=1481888 RepID=A0AAU9JKW3_9CILI|nr:unnamed protein product [Blepharisma stoltei]
MSSQSSKVSSNASRQIKAFASADLSEKENLSILSEPQLLFESQSIGDSILKAQIENQVCPLCKGHDQYTKVLQDALREVLDQNEVLRTKVFELEAMLNKTEDEVRNKNELIFELESALSKAKPKRKSMKKNKS